MFLSDFKIIENWANDIGLNWFLTLKYDQKNIFYEIDIESLINTCSELSKTVLRLNKYYVVKKFEYF